MDGAAPPGFDDDEPPGASCEILCRARHRIATVTVRDSLIGWVQAGRKTLLDARGAMHFGRGEVFLVAAGTQWDVINDPAPDGRYQALVLQCSADLLQRFEAARPPLSCRTVRDRAHLACDAELGEALARAARSLQAPALSAALRRHRLAEVLLMLAERGFGFEPAPPRWEARVRRLVAARPQAPWTIGQLARHFHLSASTLRRRLAAEGLALGELVREVRLETGLLLLQTTALGVGEIAARCGYESHSRFSAAFRQRFGFAPSQLRPPAAEPAVDSAAQRMTPPG